MDVILRMHSAVEQILNKIRPKVTAILRTRAYYGIPDLILQVKIQIWGLIEAHMAGYSHAASSMLVKIDDVHYKFLRELEVCPVQAFREFAFAPPSLRRHVGLLGLLYKKVIGKMSSDV